MFLIIVIDAAAPSALWLEVQFAESVTEANTNGSADERADTLLVKAGAVQFTFELLFFAEGLRNN